MWIWTSALFLFLVECDRLVLADLTYKQDTLFRGSRCELGNGAGQGVCLKAIDCPSRMQQIYDGDYTSEGRCGFENFDEIYCCPMKLSGRNEDKMRPAETACKNHRKMFQELDGDGYFFVTVINGTLARQGEFPHMAALGYAVPETEAAGGMKYVCGGTLISEKHVLTAAHCVSNIDGLVPVEVLLGTIDLDNIRASTAQRIPISKIITHPRYKRSYHYHDVAILELRYPIKFTIDVYPTCLMTKPLSRATVTTQTSLVVLGWGATDLGGSTSTKLLKAERLKLVNKKTCCKQYENTRVRIPNGLDDAMICVRDSDTNRGADTCWGDSGGPLLISAPTFPLLIGITSFGQACGGIVPGVYISVYRYLNWIEEQVWPIAN